MDLGVGTAPTESFLQGKCNTFLPTQNKIGAHDRNRICNLFLTKELHYIVLHGRHINILSLFMVNVNDKFDLNVVFLTDVEIFPL